MATFRPTKRSTPTSPIQRLRRSLSSESDEEPTASVHISDAATAGSDASASTDDEKAVLSHWDSDNALDATDLPGLDEVPALDLFGTDEIKRQWKSLEDLDVLDSDGKTVSAADTKPTFISGFIVRQLVKDGVIGFSTPT